MEALIKQFKSNADSNLIRHFDLLYAQQGITRLSLKEQAELFPALIADVGADNSSVVQNQAIFNLLLRALVAYPLPPKGSPENDKLRDSLSLGTADISFLTDWIGKLMLLKISGTASKNNLVCPGLSFEDISFLTLDRKTEIWDHSAEGGLNLTEVKVKALAFLSSGAFNDAERLIPVLIASGEPNSRISDTAEDTLKRVVAAVKLDSDPLVDRLYGLYFGKRASEQTSFVSPVNVRLRTRIINLLGRTTASAKHRTSIIRLVEEDLLQDFMVPTDGSKSDREVAKLRAGIVNFLTFLARSEAKSDLDAIALPVIQSLKLFVEQEKEQTKSMEIRQVRGNSFEIIGLLASANVDVIREPKLDLLKWLFSSLGNEIDKEVLVSIDQALSTTLRCFQSGVDGTIELALQELLLHFTKQASNNTRNVRYAAVRFANRCLSFENVVARWIDIYVIGRTAEMSHEAVEEAKKGLDPYWSRMSRNLENSSTSTAEKRPLEFPQFTKLVEYLFWDEDGDKANDTSILAVNFSRQTLMWEALSAQHLSIEIGPDWDRKLDLAVAEDLGARKAIRKHLALLAASQTGRDTLMTLCNGALRGAITPGVNVKRKAEAAKVFVDLCILLPDAMKSVLSRSFTTLEQAILDNDSSIRSSAAQAYGLLASQLDCDPQQLNDSLQRLSHRSGVIKLTYTQHSTLKANLEPNRNGSMALACRSIKLTGQCLQSAVL